MKLHFFFIAIIASSIGPYIGLGFRLEHPIIYILFFYLTILFIKGKKVNKHISILTLPLLISLIITVVFDLTTGPKIRVCNFFSNVDNLSQPVILIFIFSLLMDSSFNTEKFKKALMFFMKISIIAGITSILTILYPSALTSENALERFSSEPDIDSRYAHNHSSSKYVSNHAQ